MDLSAIVLAGGQSRRMGRDKRALRWRGRSFVEQAVHLARQLAGEVVLVGAPGELLTIPETICVHDEQSGIGPLEGVRVGFGAARGTHCLVLGCDTPSLEVGYIKQVVDAADQGHGAIPTWPDGRVEPLISVYPRRLALDAVQVLLAKNIRRFSALAAALPMNPVSAPGAWYININTAADFDRLQEYFDD